MDSDSATCVLQTHTFVSTRHVEAGTAAYMAPECFGSAGVGEKVWQTDQQHDQASIASSSHARGL